MSDTYPKDPGGYAKDRGLEMGANHILDGLGHFIIISRKKLVVNIHRYDDN